LKATSYTAMLPLAEEFGGNGVVFRTCLSESLEQHLADVFIAHIRVITDKIGYDGVQTMVGASQVGEFEVLILRQRCLLGQGGGPHEKSIQETEDKIFPLAFLQPLILSGGKGMGCPGGQKKGNRQRQNQKFNFHPPLPKMENIKKSSGAFSGNRTDAQKIKTYWEKNQVF